MMKLACNNVPSYLQNGSFFQSLLDKQRSEVSVPEKYFSPTDTIENLEDFSKLLRVSQFWGLHSIPNGLIHYCHTVDSAIWSGAIHDDEFSGISFVKDLSSVFKQLDSVTRRLVASIKCGRRELVEYLAPLVVVSNNSTAIRLAAEIGRKDLIQTMRQHGLPWDKQCCYMAARFGHVDCLMYLHTNGCPWDDAVTYWAAEGKHQNCMEYAINEGLLMDRDVISTLALNGQLQMLQYALDRESRANSSKVIPIRFKHSAYRHNKHGALIAAASKGHLECLKLLREYDIPWRADVACAANNLDCLKYLHENGCPWDARTTKNAVSTGNVSMLRYAAEHGCPVDENAVILSLAVKPAYPCGAECLQYLVETCGYVVNEHTLLTALGYANIEAVLYLLKRACPIPPNSEENENYLRSMFDKAGGYYFGRNTHDLALKKCIVIAVKYGWVDLHENNALNAFVGANKIKFPACAVCLEEKEVGNLLKRKEVPM